MLRMASTLAVLLLSTGVAFSQPCPDGEWCQNPANGHWYKFTASASWQDAEDEAVTESGHLVTVDDQAEHDWIEEKFPRPSDPASPLWIGYYQDCGGAGCTECCAACDSGDTLCTNNPCEPGSCWAWISGELSAYENWAVAHPNNGQGAGGPSEDCGEMYHTSQATDAWTDRDCESSQPGLIETTCGDGVFDSGEECDDGNKAEGDGCSSGCLVEDGFSCKFEPSTCDMCADPVPTVSEWGLIVIGLLILTGGTAIFGHRRLAAA
jgi:cysteine-rich repeat protein